MAAIVADQSSDLCTACGLCCAGAIFDQVAIGWDELGRCAALGLPVISPPGGATALPFPCPGLDGASCTVYDQRPRGCRDYRCVTLKQLDRAEITLTTALERVAQALACKEAVDDALGSETIPQFRQRRLSALQQGRALPKTAARDAINALDEVLDAHFRTPEQGYVHEFAAVEQAEDAGDGWIAGEAGTL